MLNRASCTQENKKPSRKSEGAERNDPGLAWLARRCELSAGFKRRKRGGGAGKNRVKNHHAKTNAVSDAPSAGSCVRDLFVRHVNAVIAESTISQGALDWSTQWRTNTCQ